MIDILKSIIAFGIGWSLTGVIISGTNKPFDRIVAGLVFLSWIILYYGYGVEVLH